MVTHGLSKCSVATLSLLGETTLASRLAHDGFFSLLDPAVREKLPDLSMTEVLAFIARPQTLVRFREGDTPDRFFQWIIASERELFSIEENCAVLLQLPLFPTTLGTFKVPTALVTHKELPDLGMDWIPHPRIPSQCISLLERHLGIGRPDPLTLVQEHFLPKYRAVCSANSPQEAAMLLTWALRNLPREHHKKVFREPGILLECSDGSFAPLGSCCVPPENLCPHLTTVFKEDLHMVSVERYPQDIKMALRELDLPQLPALSLFEDQLINGPGNTQWALSLAALLGELNEKALELSLEASRWLLSGSTVIKRPGELYRRSLEVEVLIGDSPDLFPDPRMKELLGERVFGALNLKTDKDISLMEVVRYIEYSSRDHKILPLRVYQWIDLGLKEGWINGGELASIMEGATWICSDDGEFYNHKRVVGVRALQLFGNRWGYWERGLASCPVLARQFGIAATLTPQRVRDFLREIGDGVTESGSSGVLSGDHALSRMLLSCYAWLGAREEGGPQNTPCILARAIADPQGAHVLVSSDNPRLLVSDTPTLEALFRDTGELFLTMDGPPEDQKHISRFYQLMKIRRLREAYTIEHNADQVCVTEKWAGHISSLVSQLDALWYCMPRIERKRDDLDEKGWAYHRIREVLDHRAVEVYSDLKVQYVLSGVGSVTQSVDAIYDRKQKVLLVDEKVLAEPQNHSSGLAQGLIPALYTGRSEEMLVDIIELVLPHRTRERMSAYMDLRHFPQAISAGSGEDHPLKGRIRDVLDYGIHQRLREGYPELRGADFTPWREAGLLSRITKQAEHDGDAAMATVALVLLEAAG
ncbi:hypothetical protein KJ865_01710, partial [Myxococcota bacterium]|nr:hypothetical protein [Myxococcota bacterium]